MAEGGKGITRRRAGKASRSEALTIAEGGVKSSGDFRNLMSALMTDVIRGSISPEVTNAACNAGGKLLKMVELEYKYMTEPDRRNRDLDVAGEIVVAPPALTA
jgi:hypothetical protein